MLNDLLKVTQPLGQSSGSRLLALELLTTLLPALPLLA